MLPIPVLLIFVIVAVWLFTRSASKSVEPTPDDADLAATATGDIEFVKKVKYVELKKIGSPNPGFAGYAGTMNVGLVILLPKSGSQDIVPASALTATASSQLTTELSADQVIAYPDERKFWHSKLTPDLGEWVRVELKEPMALDRIMILNRQDATGTNGDSARILGTQVTIMDTEGKPIKTYVITENSKFYTFAAS